MSSNSTVQTNLNNTRGWKLLNNKLQKLNGGAIIKKVRKLERMYKQQAQTQNNTVFLHKCRKFDVIPKGLQLNCIQQQYGKNKMLQRLQEETERKLMKTTLRINYQHLNNLDNEIKTLRSEIRRDITTLLELDMQITQGLNSKLFLSDQTKTYPKIH